MGPKILNVFLASRSQDQGPQSCPPWGQHVGGGTPRKLFYLTSLKLGGSSIHQPAHRCEALIHYFIHLFSTCAMSPCNNYTGPSEEPQKWLGGYPACREVTMSWEDWERDSTMWWMPPELKLTKDWRHRSKNCWQAFVEETGEALYGGATWADLSCTSKIEREGNSRKRKECVSYIEDKIQFWEPLGQKLEVGPQETGLEINQGPDY